LGQISIVDEVMKRIIVQIEPETLSELDQAARESHLSRSAFVRAAVQAVLAEGRRRKELKQVVDSYRSFPQENFTILTAHSDVDFDHGKSIRRP
jgi:metal-responsive CopG/Arc/MetJ family transcriptional regulator